MVSSDGNRKSPHRIHFELQPGDEPGAVSGGNCLTCGAEIVTMVYKNSGACGEAHRKVQNNDYGKNK